MLPPLFLVALGVFLLLIASALSFNLLCRLMARSWPLTQGKVVGYRYDKSYGATVDSVYNRTDEANSNTTTQLEVAVTLSSAKKYTLIIPNLRADIGQIVMLRLHPRWPQLLHYQDELLVLSGWKSVAGVIFSILAVAVCVSLSLIFFRLVTA